MKVLGISSNYHDASAALVVDGRVISASAEERFSYQKHDPSFPKFAIDFCLKQANIKSEEIDLVVFHEEIGSKISRTTASSLLQFPFSFSVFLKSMKKIIMHDLRVRQEILSALNIEPRKVVLVPHHMSHAAHAFVGSPFESSAIVTLDAIGEWTCSAIFYGDKKCEVKSDEFIKPLEVVPFPNSIGLFYSAFTAFLGFKVNDEECSTMALATFGRLLYVDEVRKILQIFHDKKMYKLNLEYFQFNDDSSLPLTQEFMKIFGQPRNFKQQLSFDCLSDEEQLVSADEQRFADIAASVQCVLEEVSSRVLLHAREITKNENLCLSGGVALNAVANGKYLTQKIFKNIYVPPDPGDGGGAMGAALLGSYLAQDAIDASFRLTPYLGEQHKSQDLLDIYYHSNMNDNIELITCENSSDLVEATAKFLSDGNIVGWVQGRFENGPRALGNRSILIDPARVDVAKKLSSTVKKRAAFRPYACSMTPDYAKQIFEFDLSPSDLQSLRWMQFTLKVKQKFQQHLRAALHVDLSTRPQVCFKECNPLYHQLIHAFGEKSGYSAILNTSFNNSGMPLVNSPLEAFAMFIRTSMDVLVVNNLIFRKKNS